jgi:hypothetical protein
MTTESHSPSPGSPEDFDWKQLKDMGGEDGELGPQSRTIPLDALEGVDAYARPDLARQILPETSSPEEVIDGVHIEQQVARIREYASHLRPHEGDTINAYYGLDGLGEKTLIETAQHLGRVGANQTRQDLLVAENHIREQAKAHDRRDEAKYLIPRS